MTNPAQIEEMVKSKPAFIFMKGTPDFPQCGFSARASEALRLTGVDFGSFNIFDDQNVYMSLKEYTNWPTSPQIFVSGEFVGGCDIVVEMFESGELQKMVDATKK